MAGFFPQEMFHWKYVVFHGVAVGLVRFPAQYILNRIGYSMDSFVGAVIGLTIALLLLFVHYGLFMTLELLIVFCLRCKSCRKRSLTTA